MSPEQNERSECKNERIQETRHHKTDRQSDRRSEFINHIFEDSSGLHDLWVQLLK